MNLLKVLLLTQLVSLIILNKSFAQSSAISVDSLLTKAFATDEILPLLVDSAIKNSAEVTRIQHTVEYATDIGNINKNSIYNGLAFVTSYNYGTNYSASNNQSASIGNINAFTKAQTGFYNVGIGLQLPFSQIINRKSVLHADQSLVKANKAEKEKAELYVKQEVIRLYQDLKLAQKLVTLSSKNKKASQINYAMAEKNFIQGQSSMVEITSIQDIMNKAGIEFETYVNRYQYDFMQLEAFTGTNITALLKQIK